MIVMLFCVIYLLLVSALCRTDLKMGLLPDALTCPLLWSGLLFQLCLFPENLHDAVAGAMAGYGVLWCLYWGYRTVTGQEGIGYGDLKFLAALGSWHRWQALAGILIIAALCGLLFCLVRGGVATNKTAPLPFGPFLALAGLITGYCEWQFSALPISFVL